MASGQLEYADIVGTQQSLIASFSPSQEFESNGYLPIHLRLNGLMASLMRAVTSRVVNVHRPYPCMWKIKAPLEAIIDDGQDRGYHMQGFQEEFCRPITLKVNMLDTPPPR